MVINNSKQHLIESVARLFHTRGYNGVGLNEIIKESGIPNRTFVIWPKPG